MLPVSDRWNETICQSHTKVYYVDLWRYSKLKTGALSVEKIAEDLPIQSGSVTDDRSAAIRRRCNLRLPGTPEVMALLTRNVPGNGGLWPTGNELRIRSGIRYDDGTEETVPMGVFRVAQPTIIRGPDGIQVELTGYDRSRTISRARFTEPAQFGTQSESTYNWTYQDLIMRIVQRAYGTRLQDVRDWESFDPSVHVEPVIKFKRVPDPTKPKLLTVTLDDDPWTVCLNAGLAIGEELQFDQMGDLVMEKIPDPGLQEVTYEYIEGEEATFTDLSRVIDDERAYNGVIVTGQSSSTDEKIVRGEAWDTDPESPTYYRPGSGVSSNYGPVPYFYSSQYIYNNYQAQEVAKAMLKLVSGFIETITFDGIMNPAQESGDVVAIQNLETGVDTYLVLDTINYGLGYDQGMNAAGKRRRNAVGTDPEDDVTEIVAEPDSSTEL